MEGAATLGRPLGPPRSLEPRTARLQGGAPPTGLEPVSLRLTAGRATPTGLSGSANTDLSAGIAVWCCGSNRREFVDSFMDRPSTVDSRTLRPPTFSPGPAAYALRTRL